jgi:ABC-type polysaccharide/polyol phosphate export permease
MLSPVCARFRDLAQVIASILQVMFFFTPIFWVPGGQLSRPILVEANPFYHLLQLLRAPLLGELPTALNWQVSVAVTVVAGVGALASLAATRRHVYLWL